MNKLRKFSKDIYYLPCYSIAEAALYLRLPKSTLRSWVRGQYGFEPIIMPANEHPLSLSFINLVEAYVLASIRRKYKISFQKVRRALDYISIAFPSEHPLADKDFETDGLTLFIRESGIPIDVILEGQTAAIAIIKKYLERIERAPEGLPLHEYPKCAIIAFNTISVGGVTRWWFILSPPIIVYFPQQGRSP